jgi:hypothetical protein
MATGVDDGLPNIATKPSPKGMSGEVASDVFHEVRSGESALAILASLQRETTRCLASGVVCAVEVIHWNMLRFVVCHDRFFLFGLVGGSRICI